jgi:tripartite-type tricarboxylate transporter receptor subunit TctC
MKKLMLCAVAAATIMVAGEASADCDWVPERPVTVIVPWGAGGTTDSNARMMANLLQKTFDEPFNVVNRTGGNGVTGHSAISRAKPDGYTIGAVTVEINTMHFFGLTDLTYKDITPISKMLQPAASVMVGKDSKFHTLGELLDYARAHPGELKGSGTSLGGIWHLALAGMLNAEGMPSDAIRWIPSQGSAGAMQELLAGGVDVVTPSLEEGKPLIDSGEVRALAVMSKAPNPGFPDVPTTYDLLPSHWTMAAYTTISGPKDLPASIACSYEKAIKGIMASPDWAEFQKSRGGAVDWGSADDLEKIMTSYEKNLGDTIKAAGMAK